MELTPAYVRAHVPALHDNALIADMASHGTLSAFPTGEVILRDRQFIDHIPLVTRGGAKVIRESGPEEHLFLYFLEAGQTCTMTLAACLRRQASRVRATTVAPTEVILLPSSSVYRYSREFPAWNAFALLAQQDRFDTLMATAEHIAFSSLAERLLTSLTGIARITGSRELTLTHEAIAGDLGVSRVGLSRVLKGLELDGRLRLGRGVIYLV